MVVEGADLVVLGGTLEFAGDATLGAATDPTDGDGEVEGEIEVEVEVEVEVPDGVVCRRGRCLVSVTTALLTWPGRDLIPRTPTMRPRTVTKTPKAVIGPKRIVEGRDCPGARWADM